MTANPLPPFSGMGTPTGMPSAGNQTSGRFKQVDPIRLLRQKMVLLMVTGLLGIVLGVGVWGLLRAFMPRYESHAILQVEPAQNASAWGLGDNQIADTTGKLSGVKAEILNQSLLIESPNMIQRVLDRRDIKDTKFYTRYFPSGEAGESETRLDDAIRDFKDQLNVSQVRGSTSMQLQFIDSNKNEVQRILNAVEEIYLDETASRRRARDIGLRQTFSQIRVDAEQELRLIQQELSKFLQDYEIPSLRTGQTDAQIAYEEFARQMIQLEFAKAQIEASYNSALAEAQSPSIAPTPEEMNYARADLAVRDREERIRSNMERINVLSERYGPNHPTIKEMKLFNVEIERELDKLIERVVREYRTAKMEGARAQLDSVLAQLEVIVPQLDAARQRMTDLTIKIEQYEQLSMREKMAIENRDRAVDLLNQMRVMEERPDVATINQLVPATKAELISPKPIIVIPGVMIGLMALVVGYVFLREMVDQRVKSPTDVKALPNVDMLGMLPDVSEDPFGQSDLAVAVRTNPAGLMAESFRQIRTSILARMDRRGYKTLMIVGAKAQSGVSIVASNLATSLAFQGRRVLVLDANFRRPQQDAIFGVPEGALGLVDVLQGSCELDQAIAHLEEPVLDVLGAGRSAQGHPELLEGQAFRNLLATLESRYDLILIDAPPALLASDSALLAKQVDALVLVVRALQDKQGMVERMVNRLDGHRADLLGVVLNGVRSSAGGYFRRSYREFYQYTNGSNGNGRAVAESPGGKGRGGSSKRSALLARKLEQEEAETAIATDRTADDLADLETFELDDEDKE